MAVALSSLHDQRDRAPEFFAKYAELERQLKEPSTPATRRARLAAILAEIGEVLTREARPSMMPSEEYLESLPLADRRLMERVIEILPFYITGSPGGTRGTR